MTKTPNEELDKLLRFDPLDTAERMTGKDSATDKETVGVGFVLMQAKATALEQTLTERGDTTFRTELPRYLAIIESYGFERALEMPFDGQDGETDTYYIYAHRDGLLLTFDTYWNRKSINGAKVCYNWRPHSGRAFSVDGVISSGHMHKTENVWIGDHDAREALLFNLDRLRKYGEFVTPWIERPFLWLLHYMDTKVKDYDYDAINRERIAMLPAWVQEMIGPESST